VGVPDAPGVDTSGQALRLNAELHVPVSGDADGRSNADSGVTGFSV
jgi:hypothetical protein